LSNNAFIELIAKLNETQSTNFITRQLDKISREMKENGYAFRINCKIDENSKKELEKQLSAMASSLNINFNNDKSTKTSKSTTQSKDTTTTTVKIDKMSVESQIDELNKLLQSKLQGEANAVMKELVSSLRNSLGETTEIWTTWEKTADGALTDFSVSAKKATGDLEKFNFVVNETGKVNLLGSSGSDKGILQKQKETLKFIDEYTAKINSLRSPSTQNFTASYNGQTVTFESLDKDLENLRKGEGSIEEVRGKFVALQGAISSVRDIIKESQGKSLDPFTNAKIAAKEFNNTLKSINVDLNNLKGFNYTGKAKDMPQVSKLTNDYKELKETITKLNAVEESQRGNQWYKDFADASEKVRQLQSDIKLLNKLKREDTSSSTKKQIEELNTIKNAYREIQKLEKRRYADNVGENELNKINSLKGTYTRIINAAQERLKKQGLLTSEVKKFIKEEERAVEKARNYAQVVQQDREILRENARIEKERNDNRSRYMNEITQAYARQKSEYATLYSPKSSEEEKKLAQERIKWNQNIIDINKTNLEQEKLLTNKNEEKIKQLQEINQLEIRKQQASAHRVTANKSESDNLKQEKDTVTQIVKGYERLAKLYANRTSPNKSEGEKSEYARQYAELKTELTYLENVATANNKITAQQREQIANAKTQYVNSVKATNQQNQSIVANNTLYNSMLKVKHAYDKINEANKTLYGGKASKEEIADARTKLRYYEELAFNEEKIINESKYATQLQKEQIADYHRIKDEVIETAKAKADGIDRIKEETANEKKRQEVVDKIVSLYKRQVELYKDATSANSSSKFALFSSTQYDSNKKYLEEKVRELELSKQLTAEQWKQITDARSDYEYKTNRQAVMVAGKAREKAENEAIAQSEKQRAKTQGEIVRLYGEMWTLYKQANNLNSAQSSREEAQAQLEAKQSLAEKLELSQKFSDEQQKEIQRAKESYNDKVRIKSLDNEAIIAKQEEAKLERDSLDAAKKRSEYVNNYISEITKAYGTMNEMLTKMNNPNAGEATFSWAQNRYEEARKTAEVKEKELQTYLKTLDVDGQLTKDEQKKLDTLRAELKVRQDMLASANLDNEASKKLDKEYNDIVSKVKQYTSILSKFNNSRQTQQNTAFAIGDDPNKRITVSQQIKDNDILLKQLNDISNILSQGKDPKVLTDAQKELDKIIVELDTAKKNSQEFTNTLTNNKIANDATKNLNTIRNQINKFANFNPKAINSTQIYSGTITYADAFKDLMTRANDASLAGNADKVNALTTAFKDFEQKARAAGLTSNKFFVDMGSQLKMVLNRYISLYAVIGYIRKMVENVKNLDEAMINLRRVTDETESGYVAFLEKANKQASELKVTTSELVQQTYQWSKLGYELDDALTLSKASTIFSKVADITEEQSLKNLITILKAYGIEAKNVMDIVDKLDNINNKYAVDAAGLGDGLERSASALAMTGNSLEKSIAMLAGAGEITQNLENTGNALKVMSLRLQNMKGKLEELEEPVDDLMEVSKVQTQILNLTHNQVDIFDKNTKEFRATYDIIEDIANIWDSLNSTNRASLTEILFGKNRANIGLALIQSFQSGQTQNALKDVQQSMNVATNEYNKMMEGIEAHSNALKGAVEQLSNTILKKETVNGFIDFAKRIVDFLTLIIRYTKGWGVALGVVFAYMSGKQQIWIQSVFKGIAQWLGIIKTETEGASKALIGLKTVAQSLSSLGIGLLIGLGISVLSKFVDGLITTTEELNEMRAATHDALVDLKQNADELDETSNKLDNVAKSYTKVSTTVTNVTERKQQLQEIQNELVTSYQDEAEGIDLVNGKYSEQLKKLDEIKRKEEENFKLENAGRIARARAISDMNISESDLLKENINGVIRYNDDSLTNAQKEIFEFSTPTSPFKVSGKDRKAIDEIVDKIEGMYRGINGEYYLTGDINQARDAMSQFADQYSRLKGYNQEVLDLAIEHYNMLKEEAQIIKDMQPYLNEPPKPTNDNSMIGQLYNLREGIGNDFLDAYWKPFNDKLDEAHDKLQKIANPDDLSIFEYDTLWHETQELEHVLYEMAGSSESAKNKVSDLFNQFKIGMNENGDGLDKFTEHFKTALDETFKATSEIVTTVQEAIEKLGEGKGLSHTDAWKLLEEDTEGYLQTIKMVNGEYVFAEEELIRFKDAKIKQTIEEISLDRKQYEQKIKTLQADLEHYRIELKHQQEILNTKAQQRLATQADLAEMQKMKIKISETEDEIKKFGNLWKRNSLLVEELNNNLGKTRTISVAMETELNNNVNNLEAQVKAIDNSIDNLNARKKTLESEKKVMQEQLDVLKEQEKTLKEQMDNFKKAVNNYLKRYEESLKTQLDHIKDQKEEVKDEYDKRIKALKDENEERDLAYKKEKAILDLSKAKEQQVRTYSSARGWEYGASKEKVVEAQKNLQDVLTDEQIHALEKERDTKVEALEEQEKAYDKHIKAFQEYAKKYEDITEEIEGSEGELLAEQILGSEWRVEIENQDEELLKNYTTQYKSFNTQLTNLVNNEIKQLEASIDMKDKEINKIDEEITAYNELKNAVQNDLNEAKNALENYKSTMETVSNTVSNALETMEGNAWDRCWKIKGYNNEMAESAESASNRMCAAYGAVSVALGALHDTDVGVGMAGAAGILMGLVGSHAEGGVNSETGLAMLHGTKQKSETIFNAEDSKKLYDYVHKTPDITASMIEEATKISGFKFGSAVNNNSTSNNINLNIGQVISNTPQEFIKNIDTQMDNYFRRKLTEGYVQ
jgi:TP901 family phage tail tape measure protein